MKNKFFILLFFSFLVFISISCSKKERTWSNPYDPDSPNFIASIKGTVKNVASEGISGVILSISTKSTTTTTSGSYSLDNLKAKNQYYITLSKSGYTSTFGYAYTGDTKDFTLKITGWTGTYFSGTFACNFTSNGPSVGTADSNTDLDYDGNNLTTPNVSQGIKDLGTYSSLDSIGTVPTSGYTNSTKAYGGNCYAIRTIEGKYVKIRVTSLSTDSQQVYFDSVYQSNGTLQF